MDDPMPHGLPACKVVGCWETHTSTFVGAVKGFCNVHRLQRMKKFLDEGNAPRRAAELEDEQFALKQADRATCASVNEYKTRVEAREGAHLTAEILERRSRVTRRHKTGKAPDAYKRGRRSPAALKTCFLCKTSTADGVACSSGHFICSEEFSMNIIAQEDNPVKLAAGFKCCFSDGNNRLCRATFDGRAARAALTDDAYKVLQKVAAFEESLRSRRDIANATADLELMRIKSAWDMGQRGTELVERLSTFITTNIMLDQCPRCLSRFDLHIGCMAVKCEDVGNKARVCGADFCGWCLEIFEDAGKCHAHVVTCPKIVKAADIGANANRAGAYYAEGSACIDECKRRRRATKIEELKTKVPAPLVDLALERQRLQTEQMDALERQRLNAEQVDGAAPEPEAAEPPQQLGLAAAAAEPPLEARIGGAPDLAEVQRRAAAAAARWMEPVGAQRGAAAAAAGAAAAARWRQPFEARAAQAYGAFKARRGALAAAAAAAPHQQPAYEEDVLSDDGEEDVLSDDGSDEVEDSADSEEVDAAGDSSDDGSDESDDVIDEREMDDLAGLGRLNGMDGLPRFAGFDGLDGLDGLPGLGVWMDNEDPLLQRPRQRPRLE